MGGLAVGQWLLEPWRYDFMVQALAVGALVGLVCGALSCLVTVRGWALLGDAVSHAVTPGIVLAYGLRWPLVLGALGFGLGAVWLMGWLQQHTRLREDTVIGVVFTGFFALGLVLVSRTPGSVAFQHVLFGNLLGMGAAQVWQTVVIGGVTLGIVLARRRDLLLCCFDPAYARTIGLQVERLQYLLLTLLALTIVVAMQAVGVVLVVAMLVTPGATAALVTRGFDAMVLGAMGVGVAASVLGTYTSYYLDASTGGCIVLAQTLLFFGALGLKGVLKIGRS